MKSCQRAELYLYRRAAASHCIILVPDPKRQSVRKVLCVPLRPPQRLPTGGPHPSPPQNEHRPAADGSSAGWLKKSTWSEHLPGRQSLQNLLLSPAGKPIICYPNLNLRPVDGWSETEHTAVRASKTVSHKDLWYQNWQRKRENPAGNFPSPPAFT